MISIKDRPKMRKIGKGQADLLWQLHDDQPHVVTELTWAGRNSDPSKMTIICNRRRALELLAAHGFVRLWFAPHVTPQRKRRRALWAAITSRGRDWLYLWPNAPGPSEAVKQASRPKHWRVQKREFDAVMAGRN